MLNSEVEEVMKDYNHLEAIQSQYNKSTTTSNKSLIISHHDTIARETILPQSTCRSKSNTSFVTRLKLTIKIKTWNH